MKRLFLLPVVMLFLFPGISLAKPIDVEVILDLLDAGVSEASIQRFVGSNRYTVQLTAEDLVNLKKAGASDELIEFLQETEEAPSPQAEEETHTAPSTTYESDDTVGAVTYSSPDVYFGFGVGIGFGYPYYSSYYYPYYPYYYSGYYYPAYPIYSPYPCGSGYYPGYYPGGTSGTGVYSYWYRNQAGAKPRPTGGVGVTSTASTGNVLRTAPSPGSAPQVTGGRSSSTSGQSVSTPGRSSQGGMSGVRSSPRVAPRSSGASGVRSSPGGAPRSSGASGVRSSPGGAPRSSGASGVRGSRGGVSRGGGMSSGRSSGHGGGFRGGGGGFRGGGGGSHGGGRGGRR
ncbi:MAG: hypothetical protein L0170_09430 [Acidobacteria bacterium]|nr:hypothetical protein [Acidobacteriota bacterium]